MFLLLLCNDKAVLGPRVNPLWLNLLARPIGGELVELSLILAADTLFPSMDVNKVSVYLSMVLVVLSGLVVLLRRRSERATEATPSPALDKMS